MRPCAQVISLDSRTATKTPLTSCCIALLRVLESPDIQNTGRASPDMTYDDLLDYVNSKMRMSHIYQPVMLLSLLEGRGSCHQEDIAAAILKNDPSQLEHYTKITTDMVGKVLRKNGLVEREGKFFSLAGFDDLSPLEVERLKLACKERLITFLEERGDSIWSHRRKSDGYISGTVRYEVLKRARARCELCGISHTEKALEVDHIVPRNCGGSDDISNLQALCYSCNAMKRDRDDSDFRDIRGAYDHRESGCLFCEIDRNRIVAENELAYVIRDGFPVTEGHSLIIPKQHLPTYFNLGQAQVNAITSLLNEQKASLEADDNSIKGFNIGMNCGEASGQTIFHCHVHLIPRREGDVDQPRGGVRHTIPGKGAY